MCSARFYHNKSETKLFETALDLSGKDLKILPEAIGQFSSLQTLDLKYNKLTSLPEAIGRLSSLQTLDLMNNQLTSLPEVITRLSSLQTLDLMNNQLTSLPETIGQLSNLQTLSLINNKLTTLPEAIGQLSSLQTLGLKYNKLTSLPETIGQLSSLQTLDLNSNQLTTLPETIGRLSSLQMLFLVNNQLTTLPEAIGQLSSLQTLGLKYNKLTSLPETIGQLSNLQTLDLNNNQLTTLPETIGQLSSLQTLDLRSNPLTSLPVAIGQLSNLQLLHLDNDQLTVPPQEIVQQGLDAIRNYFRQLASQGKDYIYEAKMMILGEPGAGKTTLAQKLFKRNTRVPNHKQTSTTGIEIHPNLEFTTEYQKKLKAHVWDFGGQQIQYMLHQFFITPDCLYVLMAEKRRELSNFDYWLNIIHVLGEQSPIIVLFNEINIDAVSSFVYDEKKYRELFPELRLQRQDVDLAQVEDGRFDALLNLIKYHLNALEHIGQEVPAMWVKIRAKLEQWKKRNHIHISEYTGLCRQHEIVKEKDQLLILRYFHLLGTVLHFENDHNLRGTIFLNPNWVVDAIYAVLTKKEFENNKGFIQKTDIESVWKEKNYDFEIRGKLLQLMKKDNFEICYELPGDSNTYCVPILMPSVTPDFDWDKRGNLQFRFQYPFMPKGITSRLIVRLHENIKDQIVWSKGVVIQKKEALAQVIEKESSREGLKVIEIRVAGSPNHRLELLGIIRHEIEAIHSSSFPTLKYSEMIPCCCEECIESQNPNFFACSTLDNYMLKDKLTIECHDSGKRVKISNLIGCIFNPKELKERFRDFSQMENLRMRDKPTNIINITNQANATAASNQKQEQQQKQKAEQTVTQNVKVIKGQFENLKADILDEMEIRVEDDKEKQSMRKELDKVDQAFGELEKTGEAGEKELASGVKNRLEEFIENLSDNNSRIKKALGHVHNGVKKVQKLARIYNKFASYFALPSAPDILLGDNESE